MFPYVGFFSGSMGPFEILLVLFVILLLFGSKKLPELARSLGKSLGEFKKGKDEGIRALTEESPSDKSEKDPVEKK